MGSGNVARRRLNPSTSKLHWKQQRDLVIEGFNTLITMYDPDSSSQEDIAGPYPMILEVISSETIESKKQNRNPLRYQILPLLQHQITSLSLSLEPARLWKEPVSTFELILGLQSQFNQFLDLLQSALESLCAVIYSSDSGRTNDHDLKELKYYRGEGLHTLITHRMLRTLIVLFKESQNLIKQMTFEADDPPPLIELNRKSIIEHTSATSEGIQSTIEWLDGSELDLVQWDWPRELYIIDEQLVQFTKHISGDMLLLNEGAPTATNNSTVEGYMALAKSILPIIKLSRLFLKKLSRRGMNKEQLPLFTRMRSDQLGTLARLAETIRQDFEGFVWVFKDPRTIAGATRGDTTRAKHSIVETNGILDGHFTSALLLMTMYLIPLIPDDTERLTIQTHYKTWFADWYVHFRLALHNLEDVFNSSHWRSP
ncbi:hypothetical protein MJO29_015636 [Puccinia striiformis f. sp. tritici]|nr:hypothetical protein MJO29_015636 [Puccinia striiformis f. sp. tritici]